MRKELQAELPCHRYSLPTLSIEKENKTMTDYSNNISAKLEIIKASEITPREVRWLWYPYIPFGKVTLLREALGRLRECLDFALGNQLIKVNPCLIVEVPWTFKQSKEEIALTQTEQDDFLTEMEDSWYKEMFYFMCLTGVRVGELGGIKWSDIDFKKKIIHVRRSLSCSYYNGEKKMMLVTPKTVNSIRDIPFLDRKSVV